jgi:hypothetical protein
MTSQEFAEEVGRIVYSVKSRIIGIGSEQYEIEPDVQRFENRDMNVIFRDAYEELDDLIVYIAQLRIRLSMLEKQFDNFSDID